MSLRHLLAIVLFLLPPGAFAVRQEGIATSINGNAVRYRESHWIDGTTRTVLYRCPDGRPFARKVVEDGPFTSAPDFVLDDARSGYREGVRGIGAGHEMFFRPNARGAERGVPVDKTATLVVDAGFDAFLRERWDELVIGSSFRIQFVIPGRLQTADFDVSRLPDGVIEDLAVRRYRLKLGAWYGFVLPRIDVAYSASDRRLRRYEGLSNIRDDRGANMTVRIDFPLDIQHPSGDIADPALAVLDGHCKL